MIRIADAAEGTDRRAPSYTQVRSIAQRLEAAGYDSLWFADHLLYHREGEPVSGIWECWTVLSALAEATKRVELGTLTICSSFRNPAILAKMAATLDEVSGGRLILGLGAGWNEPEYTAFGLPFDHRVDRFEEALQIIAPLLRTGHVDFAGRYYSARDCELVPRGPRPAGPPILIGAEKPRMLRLAAEYGDLWNTGYFAEVDTFAGPRAAFEKIRAEVGPAAARVGVTALLKVGWADLGPLPKWFGERYVTGDSDRIAATLRGYADAGVAHVMLQYWPNAPEAVDRLVEAIAVFRR